MSDLFPDRPISAAEFAALSLNYESEYTRKKKSRNAARRKRCQRVSINEIACPTAIEGDNGENESPRLPTVGGMPEAGHKP
jgi:hypothetical protein